MKAGMARIRAMMPIRIEAILSMAPMSHGVRGPARAFRFVAVSTRFVLLPWVHATRIILGSFPHRSAGCRSEEHTSELQSLMRISYAVFCLKKKNKRQHTNQRNT